VSEPQERTGRDNAERFIADVLTEPCKKIVRRGEDWPWMCNGEWREYVLRCLNTRSSTFKDIGFAGCGGEEWMLVAYKKSSTSQLPIERRSLDDPEEE
jgi:hypothetical protein